MRELVLGQRRAQRGSVVIPARRRERHLYIVGRSGAGKSSLLHRLIHQDVRPGYAVVVFDPGDLVRDVYAALPDRLRSRVRYFSVDHPLPYNPLAWRRDEPARLENELFSLIDQVTAETRASQPLTPRMVRLLSAALRAVLAESEPT